MHFFNCVLNFYKMITNNALTMFNKSTIYFLTMTLLLITSVYEPFIKFIFKKRIDTCPNRKKLTIRHPKIIFNLLFFIYSIYHFVMIFFLVFARFTCLNTQMNEEKFWYFKQSFILTTFSLEILKLKIDQMHIIQFLPFLKMFLNPSGLEKKESGFQVILHLIMYKTLVLLILFQWFAIFSHNFLFVFIFYLSSEAFFWIILTDKIYDCYNESTILIKTPENIQNFVDNRKMLEKYEISCKIKFVVETILNFILIIYLKCIEFRIDVLYIEIFMYAKFLIFGLSAYLQKFVFAENNSQLNDVDWCPAFNYEIKEIARIVKEEKCFMDNQQFNINALQNNRMREQLDLFNEKNVFLFDENLD